MIKEKYMLVPVAILLFIFSVNFISKELKSFIYRVQIIRNIKLSILAVIISSIVYIILPNSEVSYIYKIIDKYYIWIYVVFIVIFLLETMCFGLKNRTRYIEFLRSLTVVSYLLVILTDNKNILKTTILIELIFAFRFVTLKMQSKKERLNDDEEIKLYNNREIKVQNIKDIINGVNSSNYSIGINGEWGSGKTQVINKLLIDLENDNNYIIHIRPMINEKKESLLLEFKNEIFKIMQANGIYNSRDNSLEEYYNVVLRLLDIDSKLSLGSFFSFGDESKTYKETHEMLQLDINILLKHEDNKYKNKLIVIIDDFDRVDEENQREIISFIKEIVDFKGCITLVALDYKVIDEKNKKIDTHYLEKLIDYRIDIGKVGFDYIMNFHYDDRLNGIQDIIDKSNNENTKNLMNKTLKDLKEKNIIYKNEMNENIGYYLGELRSKELKESKPEHIASINEEYERILSIHNEVCILADNSRRVIHMLDDIRSNIVSITNILDKLDDDSGELFKQLGKIDIARIVYLLSYLKIFFKDNYNDLILIKDINIWLYSLEIKKEIYKRRYFECILRYIINSGTSNNDEEELINKNTYIFLTEVILIGNLTANNMNIYTKTDIILNSIDNCTISIQSKNENEFVKYINIINSDDSTEEKRIERHKNLGKYIAESFNESKISDAIVANSIFRNKDNYKFLSYYINELLDRVNNKSLKYLFGSTFEFAFDDVNYNNILKYRIPINIVIENSYLIKKKSVLDKKIIGDTVEESYENLKKLCKDNELLNDVSQNSFHELILRLFEKLQGENFEYFDASLIKEDIETYLTNANSIEKLNSKRALVLLNEAAINEAEVSSLNTLDTYDRVISWFRKLSEIEGNYSINSLKPVKYSMGTLYNSPEIKEEDKELINNSIKIMKEYIDSNKDIFIKSKKYKEDMAITLSLIEAVKVKLEN